MRAVPDSTPLERARESRGKLEALVRQRQDRCDLISANAMSVRCAAQRLADLDAGQTFERRAVERDLFARRRELEQTQAAADQIPGAEGLLGVEGSRRTGYHIADSFFLRVRDAEQDLFWAEIHAMQPSVEALNDNWCREKVDMESRVARDVADNAIRRSANSFGTGSPAVRSPANLVAAIPFACFLLVALAGLFLTPSGASVWIVIGFLVLASAGAAAVVFRLNPAAGTLAGLGAASSLAFFSAAYLACRALDAATVTRQGAETLPIAHIAEACFASLTIGATGSTIGIELGGAARVVAFIQILLTLAAVATALTIGWRSLSSRIGRPPTPPLEQPRG
ncbi:MAG TPA: hypothetical protein VF085_00645 [Solirubrobacterales bacterium]